MAKRSTKRAKAASGGVFGDRLVADLGTASLGDVASALGALPTADRADILADAQRRSRSARSLADEQTRVAVAKLLVALLPASGRAIELVLAKRAADTPAEIYELQFSLFCFLQRVHDLGPAATAACDLPALIGDYLNEVRLERGHASWMAGELLGDHWRLEDTVPVLLRVAEGGRYVVGRLGAVHGLVHALERAAEPVRRDIVQVLRQIAKRDRSERVRHRAAGALSTSSAARSRR